MHLMPQLDVTFFGTGIIYLVATFLTLLYLVDSYYVPQIGTALKLRAKILKKNSANAINESRNDYDHITEKAEKIDAFKTFLKDVETKLEKNV